MNTVASLPAKLLSLVHEMTVLPAMSLTGSSVILPVLKAAEIVATMRRAAEALASPAPSAVQGLAREAGPSAVTLETSRDNKLTSGRRYVVFLSWPRETLPVAILDLPSTDGDYTATLPARFDMPVNAPPGTQPRN